MQIVTSLAVALIIFAQQGVPKDPGPQPVIDDTAQQSPFGGTGSLIMMGVLFLFMYLFLFKPQAQREKEEKSMLEKLKKNDHVVTRGGMIGVVMNVKDDEVVLKVDEQQNVKIRFKKDAIAQVLTADSEKKDEPEQDKKG